MNLLNAFDRHCEQRHLSLEPYMAVTKFLEDSVTTVETGSLGTVTRHGNQR